jgi:hypothetical protein
LSPKFTNTQLTQTPTFYPQPAPSFINSKSTIQQITKIIVGFGVANSGPGSALQTSQNRNIPDDVPWMFKHVNEATTNQVSASSANI